MASIAVIDYGMGNLHSIAKALQHSADSAEVLVTADPGAIFQADRVVFPGVGAIKDCMVALKRSGLDQVILEVVRSKPLLGICLGQQALLSESEEGGGTECMGVFPGRVVHFEKGMVDADGNALKIPHMGWNCVDQRSQHPLWKNIPDHSRFYFVHSYYVDPLDPACIAATTNYPVPFAAALAHENIFAVQFHPEKSQAAGLQLLKNFIVWDGEC